MGLFNEDTEQKEEIKTEVQNASTGDDTNADFLDKEVISEPKATQSKDLEIDLTPEVKKEAKTHVHENDEIDLFAELSKPTDKDANIKKDAEGNIMLTPEAEQRAQALDTPNRDLTNHKLTAKLTIAAINVGLGLVLQMISNDWTEEGEKKYTLSPTRKAELLEPLEIMLENSKKKYNPVLILVITVLLTYVPMFIGAFRIRGENTRKKKRVFLDKLTGEDTSGHNTEDIKHEEIKPAKEVVIGHSPAMTSAKELDELESKTVIVAPVEIIKPEVVGISQSEIKKRVEEIRKKKGRRNKDDEAFMKSLGL